jgi:hypothetical protein
LLAGANDLSKKKKLLFAQTIKFRNLIFSAFTCSVLRKKAGKGRKGAAAPAAVETAASLGNREDELLLAAELVVVAGVIGGFSSFLPR